MQPFQNIHLGSILDRLAQYFRRHRLVYVKNFPGIFAVPAWLRIADLNQKFNTLICTEWSTWTTKAETQLSVCMSTRVISDSATFYNAFLERIKRLPYTLLLKKQILSRYRNKTTNQRREVIECHSDYLK